VAALSAPADGSFLRELLAVTGNSADPGSVFPSEVKLTQVRIQRDDTVCWHRDNLDWSGDCAQEQSWLSPEVGTPWTKTSQLPPSNNQSGGLQNNRLYTVSARATDNSGNVQDAMTSFSFRFDVSSPTAAFLNPREGQRVNALPVILGTAKDTNPAGYNVRAPEVRIWDQGVGDDPYWNGGAWGGETWLVAVGSSSTGGVFDWSFDASALAGAWPDRDGALRLDVRVFDEANNVSTTAVTFSFDRTPPLSTITYPPVDGLILSSMTGVYGTAKDATSPVSSATIKMWYLSNGVTYYWHPVNDPHWGAGYPNVFYTALQNVGAKGGDRLWNYTSAANANGSTSNADFLCSPGPPPDCGDRYAWNNGTHDGFDGKTFYVVSRSLDGAGNYQAALTTRTFTFDNTPPVSGSSVPAPGRAYKALGVLEGTAFDATAGIAQVRVSIASETGSGYRWFNGDAGCFSSNVEVWWPVSNLYPSSWTYTNANLTPTTCWSDGQHYVVKSSATDGIGNVQLALAPSRILYDQREPGANVVNPQNLQTYTEDKVLTGGASDYGFTNGVTVGIDGTGSGVFPSQSWHQGKVEVMVFRDTEPMVPGSGPFEFGSADDSGFYWDGSTWTVATAGAKWVQSTALNSGGDWQYSTLDCTGKPAGTPCWVRGDAYIAWTRATDNAGNVQATVISQGPKFFISGVPQSFRLTVSPDPVQAGSNLVLTVESKDGAAGAGFRATSYLGSVDFQVDSGAGPESMDLDGPPTPDLTYGLPSVSTFTGVNAGLRTFTLKLRKSGVRLVRVVDRAAPGIFGVVPVTVLPSTPTKVAVIADFDPSGQNPAGGVMALGTEGRVGLPQAKQAGDNIPFLVEVVDDYWNLVVSSASAVTMTDTDPYNDAANGEPKVVVFTGSKTVDWIFASSSEDGERRVQASLGDPFVANAANPSSPVTVDGAPANRLLALWPGEVRVQGKTAPPAGKSASAPPADLQAGSTFTLRVYATDAFYNTSRSATFPVEAEVVTDGYDVPPAARALVNGATTFVLTAVTAGLQTARAQEYVTGPRVLPAGTSDYYTPAQARVWWAAPKKLQMIVEGESAAPGRPPYAYAEQTSGGRVTGPATLTAGVTTTVTVNLVDDYFNVVRGTTPFQPALQVASYTSVVELQFSDANIAARGLTPGIRSLTAGTTSFSFRPVTRSPSGMSVAARDSGATGTKWATHTVAGIIVDANAPVALRMLVPDSSGGGEQWSEGSATGKTGAAGPLKAGDPYDLVVRSVDLFNNRTADGRFVRLIANDVFADVPGRQPLAAGETTFSGFLPSAATGNLVLQAADDSGAPVPLDTQTVSGVVVTVGAADRIIVRLPGETLVPGKVTSPVGVTPTASTRTVGDPFAIDLYAADQRYNVVDTVTGRSIKVETDDPFLPTVPGSPFAMSAGGRITIPGTELRTAGTRRITATDEALDANTLGGPHASASFLAEARGPSRLRVLMPTESRVPGDTGDGRSGAGISPLAGFAVDIGVDITDSYWNLTPGASQEIRLVADDPFAVIVPTAQVVVTSATFSVEFRRSSFTYVWAEMVNPLSLPSLETDTGTVVNVRPGLARRLLVKLPGESFDQGSPTGKRGTPNPAEAGNSAYNVVVGVVDNFFNLVPGRGADVRLFTPGDAFAPSVSTAAIMTTVGYTPAMPVELRRAATGQYLTVIDYLSSGLLPDPQSSTFTIVAARPVGLQLLMPGQTAVPGSGDYPYGGTSGSISTPTAGTTFNVTVNLVDQYMNVYPGNGTLPWFSVATSDSHDIDPSEAALSNGARSIGVKLVTKSTSTTLQVAVRGQAADLKCGPSLNAVCLAAAPAAVTAPFKVFASTAVAFQVLLPGQTAIEGLCDAAGCATPYPATPGRSTATPIGYTITPTGSFQATVNLVDAYYNLVSDIPSGNPAQDSNPPAVMPEVQLSLPQDPVAEPPLPQTLSQGTLGFPIRARTSALATYRVVAGTTSASAAAYPSATSEVIRVDPAAPHHLHFLSVPSTVTAGRPVSVDLVAHDLYHNVCSTGANVYRQTVEFITSVYPKPQDAVISPSEYTFTDANAGFKTLNGLFRLKRAGPEWIKARQKGLETINSEVAGFSAQPIVTVIADQPDTVFVDPATDQTLSVRAGSLSSPGLRAITGQLADSFNNPIQATSTVIIQTAAVVGQAPRFALDYGSGWVPVGGSTVVLTDAKGRIGRNSDADNTNPQLALFVSPRAGDSTRVWIGTMPAAADLDPYISASRNLSAILLTAGGTPSKLVVVSSQPATVVNEVPASGANFIVQRRDDFENPTDEGLTEINLDLPPAQAQAHANFGQLDGTPLTVTGHYGFMECNNPTFPSGVLTCGSPSNFIKRLAIPDGLKEMPFRYRDRMASYSGPSAEENTGYAGRPGRWQLSLRPQSTTVSSTTIHLRLDPDAPSRLGFGNPKVTLIAGKPSNDTGLTQHFIAHVLDRFNNPRIAESTVAVRLEPTSRSASLLLDSMGFSTTGVMAAGVSGAPPSFASAVSVATIPLGNFQTTFYYLDTMATSSYPPSTSTSPWVTLTDAAGVLSSTSQLVNVLPDIVTRIAVPPLATPELLAGATSPALTFQVQDAYGNPSPVRAGQEDVGVSWINFELYSDSDGETQFSSPQAGAFQRSTGTARLMIGESTTSFFLIDTKVRATPAKVWARSRVERFWAVAEATYTVRPGLPVSAGFTSPERFLIAGSTVQLNASGDPIDTGVKVQLFDEFGNITSSPLEDFTVRFTPSPQGSMRGGFDPNRPIQDGAYWQVLPSFAAEVPIPANNTEGVLYVWDTKVGTVTLSADVLHEDGSLLTTISQEAYITPGPAAYITIHHPFHAAPDTANGITGPLRVGIRGVLARTFGTPPANLGVTLRDRFGNVASGHPVNRQYFTGSVRFATSGSSSSVTLSELTNPVTSYFFNGALEPTPGVYSRLQVTDTLQERLKISATVQHDSTIYGYTDDGSPGRAFPTTEAVQYRSDPDVFTAGVTILPTDMAPEADPATGLPVNAKQAVGQMRPVLRQGDGNTVLAPEPVQMLRMSMVVTPSSASSLTAELQTVRVEKLGSLGANRVTEIALYADENGNGVFDAGTDVRIGTGAFDGTAWRFGDPTPPYNQVRLYEADPTRTQITTNNRNYFIALRLATTGYGDTELPSELGLRIPSPSYITMSSASQVGVAQNNFEIRTVTSAVERKAADIYVKATDINSWWSPTGLPLSTYPYVDQGKSAIGVIKLQMWTPVFTGTLGRVRITHTGSGLDSDIRNAHLYIDCGPDGNPDGADGAFQSAIDKRVTDSFNPPSFSSVTPRTLDLTLKIDPANFYDREWRTIDPSTNTYFVVFDYNPAAVPGLTHGLQISAQDIVPLSGNGNIVPFSAVATSATIVAATSDQVMVTAVNSLGAGSLSAVPASITQADTNRPVGKLTVKTLTGAAVWGGLKLDRWVHSASQGGSIVLQNKATDVKDIRIWKDVNGNGLLDPTTDQIVSPLSGIAHYFPLSRLGAPVSPADTNIVVTDLAAFYPSDDVFPVLPQRLVLGDDQTDEARKEIVECTGVTFVASMFTDCQRAREGTTAQSFSTYSYVSGPARVPILGAGGGQTLTTLDQHFFVTYDIDPLASVGPSANLGMAIPNTSYFLIVAPKSMSPYDLNGNLSVALPPNGKTLSMVSNMSEFADRLLVVATNTVDTSASFLQQRSTVPVLSFTAATNVGDALLR
ncbi:MAG: hypothetical protein HY554_01935, partial [Elusimicrobia bacterium]|nr:hypothetical protein [Elusimicrobiota bacterium]